MTHAQPDESEPMTPFESTRKIVDKFHAENDPDYVYALVSGGGDSDTACEVAQDAGINLDGVVHVNTGVGVEDTRRYVLDRCRDWDLSYHELTSLGDADWKRHDDDGIPMQERMVEREDGPGYKLAPHPYEDVDTNYYGVRRSNDDYEKLVRKMGFPGPDMHWVMYLALKHKPIKNFVTRFHDPDDEIAFISGVRKKESDRRAKNMSDDGLSENWGGCTVVSPIADWSDSDVTSYRIEKELPSNPVSDLIGMSGECLCGSYGSREELEQLQRWGFTDVVRFIENLEWELFVGGVSKGYVSPEYGIWGHGNTDQQLNIDGAEDMQMLLCADCEDACDPAIMDDTDAVTKGEVAIRNKAHCEIWDRWFYCPDCDAVLNDPIEHRRTVHAVTANPPYLSVIPWDVREINLQGVGEGEPHERVDSPVLTDPQLTKEKRMEQLIGQTSTSPTHEHEFVTTDSDGVEHCEGCGVFRLSPDALRDRITASDDGKEPEALIAVEPGVLETIIPVEQIDETQVITTPDELRESVTSDALATLIADRVNSVTRYVATDPSHAKLLHDAGLTDLLEHLSVDGAEVLDETTFDAVMRELERVADDEDAETAATPLQPEIDPSQTGIDAYM